MLKYFPFLIFYSAVKDILIKSINEKIDFIKEKNDVVGGGSLDEQQLQTKLLMNLSNAFDEFITENHDDIQQIQGNKLIKVWNTVLIISEKIWLTIDTTIEAIDSIPDILCGYVQRFK